MLILGKQVNGQSPDSIKQMALNALLFTKIQLPIKVTADIGGGAGIWAKQLTNFSDKVILTDSFNPGLNDTKIEYNQVDLNNEWDIESESIDFAFSLEVIEHIENPRFFIREMKRVIKPGGYGFISTPNSLNLFSRINFLISGCHRFFQDSCYPAHISTVLKIDFERVLQENDLTLVSFFYNHEDVIPIIGMKLHLPVSLFSNTIGVLFRKNE